jgi:hypothetical protein
MVISKAPASSISRITIRINSMMSLPECHSVD